MTIIDARQIDRTPSPIVGARRGAASRSSVRASLLLCVATLCIAGAFVQVRWRLASTLTMQCDELPLLTRFTGLCGRATTEAQAQAFKPGLFTLRKGAIRSFRVLKGAFTMHTTTGFWTNLTIHLFGYSPAGVRAGPLFWSVVCLVAVGFGAWLVTGRTTAVCVSVAVMALSPFHVAYAAQARGYSEAMALTPLLLIFLELLRRKPDSWIRAAMAFVCALQLTLTVYTMWVFWVLPALVMAVWLLPHTTVDLPQRKMVRTVTMLILVSMLCFMAIYTAVRFDALSRVAAMSGERFNTFADVTAWLVKTLRVFFTLPGVCAVFGIIGAVALWRNGHRWWCWVIGAGVGAPLVTALVHGSPGFARHICYLIPVAAILVGLGVDVVLQTARRHVSAAALSNGVAVALVLLTLTAHGSVTARAEQVLYPDWGALVQRLDRLPETCGTRWLCPCLANHWQIDWYRKSTGDVGLLSVPLGGTMEVVMGAQHQNGEPVIYQDDPYKKVIRSGPLPDYLRRVPPSELTLGVELRRWEATRVPVPVGPPSSGVAFTGRAASSIASPNNHPVLDEPAFVVVEFATGPSQGDWDRFLTDGGAFDNGVVPFHMTPMPGGSLFTMIVRTADVSETIQGLRQYLGVSTDRMRLFTLAPLHSASQVRINIEQGLE